MTRATASTEHLTAALAERYRIERELGQGGMATVYLAEDVRHHRKVAIKVLHPELSSSLGPERFLNEIALTASLQHPHILPLFDSGSMDGQLFYVMPFVDGETLRTRMSRGLVPVQESVAILRDVARALAYAHGRGVIHRDIKPENILLSSGSAVVADFGIAKAIDASRTEAGSPLTATGTSLGTPAYMAPEQALGDPVDARSDLYAWGVIAYELMAGAHPFADKTTAQQLVAAHVSTTPRAISPRDGLSPALTNIVMRALAKDPSARPASGQALLEELDGVALPGFGARRPMSIGRLAVIGATVAVVIVAGAWMATRSRPSGPSGATEMTLAVLPIENLGGDSTTQYLADGMTGELANALKKVPGLQVAGDLSTFRFKGTHTSPAEIARQLGVRMLLTGKLQPGRGRVRLQMQLSQPDGKLLWSNTYDRESKDNFAIQDDITGAIAGEMRVVLSPRTVAVTRAGRTVNPQAHDLYLRGVFEKNKLTPEGLHSALAYFQDALTLDSTYAQAHAGVAFVYDLLADVYMPSHEYHMLSLAAAERAVRSDSLLAEARALYGYEIAAATWNLDGGRAEMERALALNPNSQDALFMYSMFSYLSGDHVKAVALADRLIRIDPLSPIAARVRAEALAWGGRGQEALKADSIATRLDSTVVIWESSAGVALLEMGRLDEAAAAFRRFAQAFAQPSAGLAMTLGRMGKRDDALRIIHELEARERRQWVDPDFIAMAYAGIGDADHTMEWLETAFRKKTFPLRVFMNWDNPFLRSVRDDPRFIDLKRRVLATTFKS